MLSSKHYFGYVLSKSMEGSVRSHGCLVVLLTTIFDYLVSVIWVLYDIYYIYGIDYIYIWMVLAMSTLDEQPLLTAVQKVPP